jgi:hypothetical protein
MKTRNSGGLHIIFDFPDCNSEIKTSFLCSIRSCFDVSVAVESDQCLGARINLPFESIWTAQTGSADCVHDRHERSM